MNLCACAYSIDNRLVIRACAAEDNKSDLSFREGAATVWEGDRVSVCVPFLNKAKTFPL